MTHKMMITGQKFGVYEIREQVNRGGMATIYRAYQPNVDRDVALKVIKASFAEDAEALRRFQQEARVVARLEHPHILPVYDFDGSHTPPYIVMRYMDGGTLGDLIAKSRLKFAEVQRFMNQVCSALDYAHRQGVMHRDIKPSNVMIDPDKNAILTDFGIARLLTKDHLDIKLTSTGALVGTPAYMAPEQATSNEPMDHRADIYGMGILLFEMVAGRPPFSDDNLMKVLMMHMNDAPPSLSSYRPDAPAGLDGVIQKAMAKKPAERYQSIPELIAAVNDAFDMVGSSNAVPTTTSAGRNQQSTGAHTGTTLSASAHLTEIHKTVTTLYANAAIFGEALAESLGSEAALDVIARLRDETNRWIHQYGGVVISQGENTLLALWGLEEFYEEDPVRAVGAAIKIQESCTALVHEHLGDTFQGENLSLDIGIHTGLALISSDTQSGNLAASGATISTAYRLMQQAEGSILVSQDSYYQVKGHFLVEKVVAVKTRRRGEYETVYRVLEERPQRFRMYTRGIEGLETPLIGREGELQRLQNAYMDVVEDGKFRSFTLVGPAGIGKSRLAYEFLAWVEDTGQPAWFLRARGLPELSETSYGLLQVLVALQFDVLKTDSPQTQFEKIRSGIAKQIGEVDELAAMVAHLAGFDIQDNPHVQAMISDPAHLARIARSCFFDCMRQLAQARPILIVLQDIHLADEASLALFSELMTDYDDLPILLIALTRPDLYEWRSQWGSGLNSHRRIDLPPLDERGSRDLLRSILYKVKNLSSGFVDLLSERAEGNPLYMEELVKILLDDRVIVQDSPEIWRLEENRIDYVEVPPTLVGLLQARFDQLLLSEKIVLQRASIFGSLFYDGALTALDGGDSTRITDQGGILHSLIRQKIIQEREISDIPGQQAYLFSSALMRDVVYKSLLDRQKKAYHQAAASWLIPSAGDRVEAFSAEIAAHQEMSGEYGAATTWYILAAERAARLGMLRDARRLFSCALDIIPVDNQSLRWRALMGRNSGLASMGELAAKKHDDLALLALAEEARTDWQMASANYRAGYTSHMAGDDQQALHYFQIGLPYARQAGDKEVEALILQLLIVCLSRTGAFEKAGELVDKALACSRQAEDSSVLARCYHNLSIFHSAVGDYGKAVELLRLHVELDKIHGDKLGEARGQGNLGYTYMLLGQFRLGQTTLEHALKLADKYGLSQLSMYTRLNLLLAYWRARKDDEGLGMVNQLRDTLVNMGDRFALGVSYTYEGLIREAVGQFETAKAAFDQAHQLLEEVGAPGYAVDALAGQARAALAISGGSNALYLVGPVWDYLQNNHGLGLEFPALAYLTCADVYLACDDERQSDAALSEGYNFLMGMAEKVSDPIWKEAILTAIPEHATIIVRAKIS